MSRLIYTARVVDTQDPDGLGRVQVALDGFEETVELPWIRMVGPYASDGFGVVFLPEVDDEVIVLQGDGDGLDQMLCIGSVYNGNRKPNYSNDDGDNNIKEIRTRSGHALVFSDEDGEERITLSTPDDKIVITLDHKEKTVTIEVPDKLHIDVADGEIKVECKDAKVQASGKITVEGDSDISVKGSTSIEVEGSQSVTVKSSSSVKVEAPQIQLSGSRVEMG